MRIKKKPITMSVMDQIAEKAKTSMKHIILPEGLEERTIKAAVMTVQQKIANVTLMGREEDIVETVKNIGLSLDGINIIDPLNSPDLEFYAEKYYEMRKKKGMTEVEALQAMMNPLYFAAMLVKENKADGMVAGAVHSTGEVLRPGMQIIRMAEGISVISCCFIMKVPNCTCGDDGVLVFADCAVNPNPTAEQLADIAISSAKTAKSLCGIDPRVAMLSFSTKGSAKHELVDKVAEATAFVKQMAPDLNVDGEIQADAALVESVGQLKCPDSSVAGKANILIFPDLQAANIGQKLVQRLANAKTIGPIAQGFALPVNDLSRGCTAEEIVEVIAITAVQAQEVKG